MAELHGCTIIAKNYLAFARVLARSFAEQHPDQPFSVFVVDETEGYIDATTEPFELLGPQDLVFPEFPAMATRYSVLELCTAVKPWLLRHLLDRTEADTVMYLDPDIRVFAPLSDLASLAQANEIVLLPHLTEPIPRDGRRPNETDILAAGSYNLGFIGLGRGARTDRLLRWWAERLETCCRIDPARSLFVDQRWVDLAPGLFSAAVVRDPGYDVAYWNLHYRHVTQADGRYLVNGEPLRFFHFSGYDPQLPMRLSRHQNRIQLRQRPTIRELCDAYGRDVTAAGLADTRAWPYEPHGTGGADRGRANATGPRPRSRQPSRRSLGQRIIEFGSLIEGQRLLGTGSLNATREVISAVNPLGRLPRPYLHARPGASFVKRSAVQGVNVVGYLNAQHGVGEVARQLIPALEMARIPVTAVSRPAGGRRNAQDHRTAVPRDARHAVNVICVNADMLPSVRRTLGPGFFRNRYTVGVWNWEVAAFPAQLDSAFELVDELWVCSEHTAAALRGRSSTPVFRICLPVVPEPPAGQADPWARRQGYKFLFMFDHLSVFERKNPLGLIDAFTDAFAPGSGASLTIKSINAAQRPDDHSLLLADASRHPDVHVTDGYLDAAEKSALMAGCDCYVSLHRAEGFGLTLAEAMYFGRPVIATGYSGNLEFMTSENSYLVDYELVPVGPGADPYPPEVRWAEPDLDHAARVMRSVFDDPGRSRIVADRGAIGIRRTQSRQRAGAAMSQRLQAIHSQRS